MGILHSEIPGLEEAVAAEARRVEQLREIAFLDIPLEMCGLEVEQFKPRHWQRLSIAGNPFVCGGRATLESVLQFFWVISPGFSADPEAAELFAVQASELLPEQDECSEEIQKYLDDAFMDRRASVLNPSAALPNTGPTAGVIRDIMRGGAAWPIETILNMPFAALFQLIRLIDADDYARAGVRPPPSFNPADRVKTKIVKLYTEGKWPTQ